MRLALMLASVLAASPGAAGECRAMLRPLLLADAPDPAALAATRAQCLMEADAGDADALYQLGLFHLGLAGVWQPDLARPMIQEAAAAGVPEAQYWLAWHFESGDLLPQDTALARDWYLRAANANHRLALGRLADAHEKAELGLARDPVAAASYRARQARCTRPALDTAETGSN